MALLYEKGNKINDVLTLSLPIFPAMLLTITMQPLLSLIMKGRTALVKLIVPRKFKSSKYLGTSSFVSTATLRCERPALLTRKSTYRVGKGDI